MSTTDNQTNMTAEEAIKILQEDNCVDCGYETESYAKCNFTGDCKVRTAMSMAVEALKAKPCTDAVSRQAVIDMTGLSEWFDSSDSYNEFVIALSELPPVMPQPKIGHWIEITNQRGTVIALRCSACEKSPKHAIRSNYCPNCGVKMVESQESEEA